MKNRKWKQKRKNEKQKMEKEQKMEKRKKDWPQCPLTNINYFLETKQQVLKVVTLWYTWSTITFFKKE